MKWLAIVLCLALFCVGLIQSAPSKDSSEELKNVSSRVKRFSIFATKVKREAKEDKKIKTKKAKHEAKGDKKIKAKKVKHEAKGDKKKGTLARDFMKAFKTGAKASKKQ
ncbi:hypothetical protein ANCCAN_02318 [Ancylostoma caninum]|uniref:Uncharacterized protein n=1 Tax=Ancylostoma caninum TaxID=29170 RepID=A0A368H8G9_ANCCA|nr:hypothetical protein ANCCAN_02318 [Ancylostoma caninum]